jgi:hypothetical protein
MRQESDDSSTCGPMFDLLPDDGPTDALAITYQESARFFHDWHERIDRRPRNMGVVSVGEQMRSAASGASPPGQPMMRGVADPTDTAAIRHTVEGYLDAWPAAGRSVTYFDSLTDAIEDVGADAATDFLESFLRMLDAHGATGYFCLDPTAHDRAVVREVTSLFDTVLECVDNAAEATAEPSISDCLETIADYRRRQVLAEVAESEEVPVADAADRVAATTDVGRLQAQASLTNVHLPKLADLGVVAYDSEDRRVARGQHFDRVEPYLRTPREQDTTREQDTAPEGE